MSARVYRGSPRSCDDPAGFAAGCLTEHLLGLVGGFYKVGRDLMQTLADIDVERSQSTGGPARLRQVGQTCIGALSRNTEQLKNARRSPSLLAANSGSGGDRRSHGNRLIGDANRLPPGR